MFKVPEEFREMPSTKADLNNGYFRVPVGKVVLQVIASDGYGWEHVSASLGTRCPTWEEMSALKNIFWSEDDLVVQFHPPTSEHVNIHNFCLHLWRKIGSNAFCETPPLVLI